MASITSHPNQKLPQLHSEVVFVGRKFPANLLRRRRGQVQRKLFQALGGLFVLREDRAEVGQRRRDLRPNTVDQIFRVYGERPRSAGNILQVVCLSLESLQKSQQGRCSTFSRNGKSSSIAQQANLVFGAQKIKRLAELR